SELAFRADAVAVANDEHPDHQLGINRRPADVAVMGLEFLVQVAESHRHEHIHSPQQVVLGDAIFEPELVEQTPLITPLPTHHRPPPLPMINQPPESRFAASLKPFFDTIDPEETSAKSRVCNAACDSWSRKLPDIELGRRNIRWSCGA